MDTTREVITGAKIILWMPLSMRDAIRKVAHESERPDSVVMREAVTEYLQRRQAVTD